MDYLNDFSDERNKIFCPYCGKITEPKNRDHVPSKTFLDKPYPSELPIIHPCTKCNSSYAQDEEYVSCLIECMRVGSTSIKDVQREKTRRALIHSPLLMLRLRQELEQLQLGPIKEISDRIERIVLKLARGHVAFELGEPKLEEPANLAVAPMATMHSDQLSCFELPPRFCLLAEVGSRAMQRQVQSGTGVAEWIIVQPGRYRYLALLDVRTEIRFVFSEYFACLVAWE